MNAPHHPREADPAAIDAALQAALASTAIAEVHKRRCEQITLHGHTPESDANKTVAMLARKVQDYAALAIDHCGHGQTVRAERLAIARKHIVTSAALAVALIDRIDHDLAQLAQEELDQKGGTPGLSGPSQTGQSKEVS